MKKRHFFLFCIAISLYPFILFSQWNKGQSKDGITSEIRDEIINEVVTNSHLERQENNNTMKSIPIVGVWRSHEISESYGIIASITIIWEFKENFTSQFRVRNSYGYKNGNTSIWRMVGQKLKINTTGNETEEYNIIWDDDRFLGFTIESDDSLNNKHFNRIKNNPFANDINATQKNDDRAFVKQNSVTCPRCNGSGHHACSLFTGDPYMNDIDFAKCMSSNSSNTQVTCYMCKGSGIWNY